MGLVASGNSGLRDIMGDQTFRVGYPARTI
jgi:hypothetical protein